MDRNDQKAIEGLFTKLAQVEQQSGQRDVEAERFIQQRVGEQPGAPYYMAQTIVVQDQALEAAQRRIEELEAQVAPGGQSQGGGFFSSIFGSSSPPSSRAPRPSPHRGTAPAPSPWGNRGQQEPPPRGGSFLAGAAQTAMGVAGGVLLGNAIMGMMDGNEAQATEPEAEPDAEAPTDDFDFGGDEDI